MGRIVVTEFISLDGVVEAPGGGEEFDRLFLRSMIYHHRGALTMVAELYASDGGLESSVDAFARHVEADQQIEIGRMQALLAELRRD